MNIRTLLTACLLLPALAFASDKDDQRAFEFPLGPEPEPSLDRPPPIPGDALRSLGIPSTAMADQAAAFPHTPGAGIDAWIRTVRAPVSDGGWRSYRYYDVVVLRASSGSVIGTMDNPAAWPEAVAMWSRMGAFSDQAAWVMAGFHLNSCINTNRRHVPYNDRLISRGQLPELAAQIQPQTDEEPATLTYHWWQGGKPALVTVPLDRNAGCSAD
jgi:hypothetical protein